MAAPFAPKSFHLFLLLTRRRKTNPPRISRQNIASAMLRSLFISAIVISTLVGSVLSHEDHGESSCESSSEAPIMAEYRPGIVTVDGHADDWSEVDGFEFALLPALDPDEDHEYKGGKMTVKALHDGNDVFFMLQVEGEYAYSKGVNSKCPSVALMFQVGENATYHNMGGCKEQPSTCTSKTCRGHEVDIMHFSIGNAIPGRLYGGNPIDNREGYGGDRFGHLVDLYAWTPHCRYLDGMGPSGNDTTAQNNWKGAWWHDSLTVHSDLLQAIWIGFNLICCGPWTPFSLFRLYLFISSGAGSVLAAGSARGVWCTIHVADGLVVPDYPSTASYIWMARGSHTKCITKATMNGSLQMDAMGHQSGSTAPCAFLANPVFWI
ncbi:uncharacterized protein LOC131225156 isoform X2 [Magnolia sinica]|uniref:uncharacterized protein LOC131225156 isoform X2 n=1 Tax=Magnolia sinica TaxID=86752 RepID=UPI00265A241C|nr:uncharacterized protein LOC131225156 isoform X2 [Magnolia sinica]